MKSLLDNDLYKFTMQHAVLEKYPDAIATYRFFNRNPDDKFDDRFMPEFEKAIDEMSLVRLALRTGSERDFMVASFPYFKPSYLNYLSDYRFDPAELTQTSVQDGDLNLEITGPWRSAILWEVPLLYTISGIRSRLHYQSGHVDRTSMLDYQYKSASKGLNLAGFCKFMEFGSRRRESYEAQDATITGLQKVDKNYFLGTSNVHFAMKHGLRALGTTAHEWTQAISALESLRHANRYSLRQWTDVYHGNLAIALTDTFGTDAFFDDFDLELAKLYDGVRQDSGDPFAFADRTIQFYTDMGIDPLTKTIVFSDSLNVEKAIKLAGHCKGRIKFSFGIGTHFTHDFDYLKPPNIVIKLVAINGIPVVKLSDDMGKEIGDPDALRIAKHIFRGDPLDV